VNGNPGATQFIGMSLDLPHELVGAPEGKKRTGRGRSRSLTSPLLQGLMAFASGGAAAGRGSI